MQGFNLFLVFFFKLFLYEKKYLGLKVDNISLIYVK